jgi:hypothetical protein
MLSFQTFSLAIANGIDRKEASKRNSLSASNYFMIDKKG